MENTSKLLFEGENTARWFVATADTWLGPLTANDLHDKIQAHEITWAHFAWTLDAPSWRRICDFPVFEGALPVSPSEDLQARVRVAATPVKPTAVTPPSRPPQFKAEERNWFLHYNEAQFGPFSPEEIGRFLAIGKIHGRVYAWRDGMATWERLERIEVFAEKVAEAKKLHPAVTAKPVEVSTAQVESKKEVEPSLVAVTAPAALEQESQTGSGEQRRAPRRPLVARILMINERDSAVNVAVCRDVSIGGMQVLTDRVPGPVGTRIKLNVSPAGDAAKGRMRPFVAEGVIVRVLEDQRGFSFRFEKLPAEARSSIEEFISQTD